MYKQKIVWLLLFLLVAQPASSGCCRRSCCGQRPINHGKMISRSPSNVLAWHEAAVTQTKAIDRYMKLGYQLESKKKWADAEQSYRYVLKVVSLRDGPGSFKSVPALEHLVTVSKAQNKLDDAINFQDTAVTLRKAQPHTNQQALLNEQLSLADLLTQKQDYSDAEYVLKDSIAMYQVQPSLAPEKRQLTYQKYAKVLRQLHKDSDTDAIDAAVTANNSQLALERPAPELNPGTKVAQH